MNLKLEIKAEAYRLGFLLAGITLPERPRHYATYVKWLAEGRHASMAYLANDRAQARRADFKLILPTVQSIVCLAIPYTPPNKTHTKDTSKGRVAAYAAGLDYHELIPPRLDALVSFVESLIGRRIEWRGYTDTGPILERDLAMSAGLGWIGKNTCLISPHAGSYFLLAEILWDLELEPDEPLEHDYCGSCRRCIEACPTECILPDRTIDAQRCISFLTIENKGAIPAEIRPKLGNWVFGCDICQQVCPWNIRFASGAGDPAFTPQQNVLEPDLDANIYLSTTSFNQKFRHSPILRAKRRGYLRNVTVAMGNALDSGVVPALRAALLDVEPLVRAHAAWALGQIGGQPSITYLEQALSRETDPTVLIEIESALKQLPN